MAGIAVIVYTLLDQLNKVQATPSSPGVADCVRLVDPDVPRDRGHADRMS